MQNSLREQRIEIFNDTQRLTTNGGVYATQTKQAIENTIVFGEKQLLSSSPKFPICPISVENAPTLDVAQRFEGRYGHVAVLNFASAKNPGGGVERGANAQEEYLCRCSGLYNCLKSSKVFGEYYGYHRKQRSTLYSDKIIFSVGVPVFKDANGNRLGCAFDADVITCAAPNVGTDEFKGRNPESVEFGHLSYREVLYNRIKNILTVAANNSVKAIVLGAFGCGVFGNDPAIVAQTFRKLLIDEGFRQYFAEVTFAILARDERDRNLSTFRKEFR
ncbi:TIGR02452 family protein [Clostridia bacterium]|nr:TIGR02452 family protein [Clostridia bacterium]